MPQTMPSQRGHQFDTARPRRWHLPRWAWFAALMLVTAAGCGAPHGGLYPSGVDDIIEPQRVAGDPFPAADDIGL